MTDWVRLWHDMPTDPKWRVIARKSGQPLACVIALFTLLMTTASAAEDRGDVSSLSIEDAAAALDMGEDDVSAIMAAMESRVIAGGRLSGWERRQPKRERENDDSSERVKRYRSKAVTAVADDVTPCNAMKRHETPREEKIREDKNITPLTPQGDDLPDWVPGEDWTAFVQMRNRMKKPMTDKARQLAIRKLGQMRDTGHDPSSVLQQSILNCWQDLFPPREPAKPPPKLVRVGI